MEEHLNGIPEHSARVVRAPAPGDYEKMADLATQLRYPSTDARIRARLEAMVDSDQYAVYVAGLPRGQIGGWIGLRILRSVEQDVCAQISGLVVDQPLRSQVPGTLLLEEAEKWARSHACGSISVHSNVDRERAHQFYMRNGYRHIKTQKYLLKSLDRK
jgi:GNAT superfamily N-acetyltransferase